MQFISIAHAEEEVPTTEQATDQGLLASLGINGTLFTFQLINFALVAAVLWFLILKPLTKKMTERQKLIDDSIDNAKRVQDNLIMSEQKYQEKIDQAKVEANKIMEKATSEASVVGAELKTKAKEEIETLVEQAKRTITIEKEEMVAGLKKETVDLVVAALEKILGEKMNSTKDKELITDMIKKVR